MLITRETSRVWTVEGRNDTYTVWMDTEGVFLCTCPFACRKKGRTCRHIKGVKERLDKK